MGGAEVIGPNTSETRLVKLHDYERFRDLFDWIANGAMIAYLPAFREFSVPREDGSSSYSLRFCPITGQALPPSLRDEWFDRLEAAGLIPKDAVMESDFVAPEPYLTDAWWRSTPLAAF